MANAALKKSPHRRTRKLEIRVSDEERARIAERVPHGWTLSAFLRLLALGFPLPKVGGKPRPADPSLVREVARIGANVNQIARGINMANLSGSPVDSLRVLSLLKSVEASLQALLEEEKRGRGKESC